MSSPKQWDVIIIGGGHNGLTCAYYLAKQGLKTCVLERSNMVGGAAITEEFHPGFRNSVASYTVSLLQPKVIQDMELERHGLEVILRKIDNFLPTENDHLLAGRNGITEREIERLSPHDARQYPKYQHALTEIVDCIRQFLLVAPPNADGGLADLLALLKLGHISGKLSLETQRNLLDFFTKSAGDILDFYFENETVKALFGFDAVVGHFASPYEPGSAYVLLHHVFGEAAGVREAWGHAIGGMGAITQAMQRACEEQGVHIETASPVHEVTVVEGAAVGVRTDNAIHLAPRIASSVHPKLLFQQLLDSSTLDADFQQRVASYQSHSGTFRMNVALRELPTFTQAPNNPDYLTSGIIMAPSLAYMDQAWSTARRDGWSQQPIIEMLIPSTLDNSLAPVDQHVASLFCQQFSYTLPDGRSWDLERDVAADHIINCVEQFAPGFKASVLGRQVLSPLDLERKFGLIGGDIFHGKMTLDQLFSARPVLGHGAYRSPIKGLYMCGSGTHPGGGVTGAPGHNAAQQILRDRRWWSRSW
ncbi:phytoene desaturase family protein [Arenicella xantha]|uniref:Pyridine nucleotide-disulfide oxidoreductase domain-containing protein 2 n=1 Tax=Arenicella xantha TaxID=644221 RepID=A0A395JNF8_9GAMM|nr:NAD(P)/FAD-dependent oxidoreductase [Arenicella xantha]RBP53191.1 phytoene dehydrogenase-like protein [Arenicella xantha]